MFILRIFLCVIVTCYPVMAEITKLKQHDISAGGKLALPIILDANYNFNLHLKLAPEVSYLVLDYWDVFLESNIDARVLTSEDTLGRPTQVRWGFKLGSRYYFPLLDHLVLYTGAGYHFNLINNWPETFIHGFDVMTGLLVAIDQRFFLDFQIPISMNFDRGANFKQLEITPSFLGMRVYF